MNKPMTISSLFLASALFSANFCYAEGDEHSPVDNSSMPSNEQPAQGPKGEENDAYKPGNSGDDQAFPITIEITVGDDESYGEVTLDETSFDNFLVALLVSQSDDTMGIGDNQFLMGARLLALTAGTGSSAGMNLPGGIKGLADELWIQVTLQYALAL